MMENHTPVHCRSPNHSPPPPSPPLPLCCLLLSVVPTPFGPRRHRCQLPWQLTHLRCLLAWKRTLDPTHSGPSEPCTLGLLPPGQNYSPPPPPHPPPPPLPPINCFPLLLPPLALSPPLFLPVALLFVTVRPLVRVWDVKV